MRILILTLLGITPCFADTVICRQIGNMTYCTTTPSPQPIQLPNLAPVVTYTPPQQVICRQIGNYTYCN